MKKLILISVLILIAGMTYGQTLQKGNFVGLHVLTINLNAGVTLDKFTEFYNTKVIPEMEKVLAPAKIYLIKGIRGENPNSFGVIFVAKTQKDRDKFYNADGTDSELGKQANEKLKPVLDELAKLGSYTTKYTDWLVL